MAELKRPDVRAFIGATGSGKGVGIRQHLAADKPLRLVIFDPVHEYDDIAKPVRTVTEVIQAMRKPVFKVAWQPPDGTDYKGEKFKQQFALLAKAMFALGNLYFLGEEMELFTGPNWQPAAWRDCVNRGRHQGLHILAATQRPAQADLAFWGACSYIRVMALRNRVDRERMAGALDVPVEQLNKLATTPISDTETKFVFYEKDFNTGEGGEKTVVLKRKR